MTFKQILNKLKSHKSRKSIATVGAILFAGALIEGLSLAQYNYARSMLEVELDRRAEYELTLKAVRVKGMLHSHESMVKNYLWPVQRQIDHPDKIYPMIHRIIKTNDDVMSSFVAYKPGTFSDRDSLFEPSAFRLGDSIVVKQVAGELHNYTRRDFFRKVVEQGQPSWTDPYLDSIASGQMVVTYAMPMVDERGETVAAFGIDLSTQWITDTINARHREENTFFLLLTEDGKLISRPDKQHAKQYDVEYVVGLINDSTCERISSTSGHSKIITFNDTEDNSLGYIYYANMKGHPHWQMVMVCYDDEVFAELRDMRRNFMLMLLAGFSLLGFILYRYNRNAKRLNASKLSKERTDSELRVAQNIQSEMLPGYDIARPDVDVSGKQISAHEVGGDLYDYFVRDEKLYFCIGDVSGKGVPASLVMAVVHSLFRSLGQHESNPARIMQAINETSCEGNTANMFVTMFIGVLDLPTGRLRYCNAGHDAPLVIEHGVKLLPVNANLPLGLFGDFKYVYQETVLPNNTTLFLYTDGLTEANNLKRELYGLPRIITTASQCLEQNLIAPKPLMDTMKSNADQFTSGAAQSDDLTMLAVHYHRPEEINILDETITLTNDIHQVPELNNFVKSVADRLNLESSLASQLMLAVEEAVVNVMSYAYPIGTQGDITIDTRATEESLSFIITDKGKAFDPTQQSTADTTLAAEDRPIGGLGILLVQQLMDAINYEHYDGKNVLTLKKNYKSTI